MIQSLLLLGSSYFSINLPINDIVKRDILPSSPEYFDKYKYFDSEPGQCTWVCGMEMSLTACTVQL